MDSIESTALPVYPHLREVVEASRRQPVVVVAPPGSGKTTLVAPALLDDFKRTATGDLEGGHVVLVQPRRLAARMVARYMARARGCELGEEVGYHVRFDRCASRHTRLFVVTPGILLREFDSDLGISRIGAVILDEFHERSTEMDLILGMACRLRDTIRPDLRLIVMSATLDPEPLVKHLSPCTLVKAEGRRFPVEIRFARRRDERRIEDRLLAILPEVLKNSHGHILVFLPGVGEILRSADALASFAAGNALDIFPLFGDLPPDRQDAAVAPASKRKLILATNVAETSLTIPGVTAVVDSGLARILRIAPNVGLPKLELSPISRASADQRAGRAGRTSAGVCWRLWEQGTHASRPLEEAPEIHRSDFAGTLLRLGLWGERYVDAFPWLDPPHADTVRRARELLTFLGAFDNQGAVTPLGRQIASLPVHPRLGRLIVAGGIRGALREAVLAAALLSERDPFRTAEMARRGPRDRGLTRSRSDLLDRVLALQAFHAQGTTNYGGLEVHPGGAREVIRVANQFYDLASELEVKGDRADDPGEALMRALLDAFPDRLAKLRPGTQDRGLMVGGRGIRIDDASSVRGEPLVLCLSLNAGTGDAKAQMVSAVDWDWLSPALLVEDETYFFNPTRGMVEARRRILWGDLPLRETPTEITDDSAAAKLLASYAKQELPRILPEDHPATAFRRRVRFLAARMPELKLPTLEDRELVEQLSSWCRGMRSLESLKSAPWLAWLKQWVGLDRLTEIERLVPESLAVPSGNKILLHYSDAGPPVLSVRIQELYGMRDSPRVGGGVIPVRLELLGPNYRPQQITEDLASFWVNTYPTVKKELRRRYPKHAWPDDPLTATASRSGLARDAK